MELNDGHIEAIRKTMRELEYGTLTIIISKNSDKLDMIVQKRIRYDDKLKVLPVVGMDMQNDNPVLEVTNYGMKSRHRIVKKA